MPLQPLDYAPPAGRPRGWIRAIASLIMGVLAITFTVAGVVVMIQKGVPRTWPPFWLSLSACAFLMLAPLGALVGYSAAMERSRAAPVARLGVLLNALAVTTLVIAYVIVGIARR